MEGHLRTCAFSMCMGMGMGMGMDMDVGMSMPGCTMALVVVVAMARVVAVIDNHFHGLHGRVVDGLHSRSQE